MAGGEELWRRQVVSADRARARGVIFFSTPPKCVSARKRVKLSFVYITFIRVRMCVWNNCKNLSSRPFFHPTRTNPCERSSSVLFVVIAGVRVWSQTADRPARFEPCTYGMYPMAGTYIYLPRTLLPAWINFFVYMPVSTICTYIYLYRSVLNCVYYFFSPIP